MPKRKKEDSLDDDLDHDDIVPIPIQFFFWNQTSMFIKQKFGTLTEAHAQNFERVLVQNILHGLSPGLSDAITSITRWSFIKASFPHIIHACAAALVHRKEQSPSMSRLSKTETKLLYTLHWLILDAASECEDNATASSSLVAGSKSCEHKKNRNYLHPVSTIQLFVYLFIPILKSLRAEDLDTLKLSNGLRIWQPLWAFRQPDIRIFNSSVKLKSSKEEEQEQEAAKEREKKQLNQQLTVNADPFLSASTDQAPKRPSKFEMKREIEGSIYMGNNSERLKSFSQSKFLSTPTSNQTVPKSASYQENFKEHIDQRPSQFDSASTHLQLSSSDILETDGTSDVLPPLRPIQNTLIEDLVLNSQNIKAPIAHMSSICSFYSEVSQQHLTVPNLTESSSLFNKPSSSLLTPDKEEPSLLSICNNCKRAVSLNKNIINNLVSNSMTLVQCLDCMSKLNSQTERSATMSMCSEKTNGEQMQSTRLEELDQLRHLPSSCSSSIKPKSSIDMHYKGYKARRRSTLTKQVISETHTHRSNIKDATFFDIAVMRCLFSPKWHTEGYLWALEYLSYRVTEISDFILREQDCYFKSKSSSLPCDMNKLGIFMGIGAYDDSDALKLDDSRFKENKTAQNTNDFIELINQIYIENDMSKRYSIKNALDSYKRKKYEANFLTRIRRMKYIDDDKIQRKLNEFERKMSHLANSSANKPKPSLPLTPFTNEEMQKFANDNNNSPSAPSASVINFFKKNAKLMKDTQYTRWSVEFEKKFNKIQEKVNRMAFKMSLPDSRANEMKNEVRSNKFYLNTKLSFSDTSINYEADYDKNEEASAGSAGLINLDGTLNLNMILKGAHSVVMKENSNKICDLTLNILENLINIDILPTQEIEMKIEQAKSCMVLSPSSHAYLNELEKKYNENVYLAADLVLKNAKWLGCIHCHTVSKSFQNDQLRGKVKLILNSLYKKNPKRFKEYFEMFISTDEINHLIDTFHALIGFCYDPMAGYGHYYPYITIRSGNARKPKNDSVYLNMISNNANEEGSFNIESVIVSMILKPLLDRLIEIQDEIMGQENIYLFGEIRNLLAYIKETHGSVFRKIVFSSMLDSYLKFSQTSQVKEFKLAQIESRLGEISRIQKIIFDLKLDLTLKPDFYVNSESQDTQTDEHLKEPDTKSLMASQDIIKTSKTNVEDVSSSSPLRGSKVKSVRNLVSDSNSQATLGVENRTTSEMLDLRRAGFKSKSSFKAKSIKSAQSISGELDALQRLYNRTTNLRKRVEQEQCIVESELIYKGLEYYRFIMECLPPASIPDVPFMSAFLELEAPVISKAAFFLELSYFVNRCNRKDWPEWIKMNIGVGRPYGSFGITKMSSNLTKRNKIYQLAAANMFSAWGEVLADKLDSIIEKKSKENTSSEKEYSVEDYFKDNVVNSGGNDCPFALQNIVCVLLLEITKFLRETYQYMPKKVTYSLKNEHHVNTYGKTGSGEHQFIPDTNRTHVGSVFSNESASVYSAQATFNNGGGNSKHKVSIDNLSSGGNNPADLHEAVHSDASKHISFVVSGDAAEKSSNYHSLQEINDEMSLPVPAHSSKPLGGFNRRSVRATTKRSSLKLRMGHRTSTFEKHNRKASHTTSHYTSDEREEDSIGNQAPQSAGEVESLNMTNEEPKPAVPRENSFTNPDAFGLNDTCEVDEVEFNRCFPWIKVVIKLLSSLNFTCEHNQSEKETAMPRGFGESMLNSKCLETCYLKLFKNTHTLVEAVLRMYETSRNLKACKKTQPNDLRRQNTSQKNGLKMDERAQKSRKNSSNSNRLVYLNNLIKTSHIKNEFNKLACANNKKKFSKESLKHLLLASNRLEKLPTLDYVYNQINQLTQIPLLLLCKSIIVMNDSLFVDLVHISWNLLLNVDQQVASSSATLFLIAAIKQPNQVEVLINKELGSDDVDTKYKAILKFKALWDFRYQVWPHLETNCHNLLKISPPCIEFVLPSPPIGIPHAQPVDPPWYSKTKNKVEEAAMDQKELKAVVTGNKSRKNHQQEVIQKAMKSDHLNKRLARENFNFTDLPYLQLASIESFMHQAKEEADEKFFGYTNNELIDTLLQTAAPTSPFNNIRQSVAANKRLQQRVSTVNWNNRKSMIVQEANEENQENTANVVVSEMQQSQPVFPSSIAYGAVCLVDLLFDDSLNSNNQSVKSLVYRTVWNCLSEDAALFLRYFFERVTQKDKKNILIQYIRRLLSVYVDLPSQTAYIIFNYLLGIVMFYARHSAEGNQEAISSILTLVWQVVSNVNGIVFKDLKQTLKKEQCDPSLLITANVPSAKKIIIHGPDLSQIPTQLPIYDTTQFSFVIQESFEFFSIPESKRDKYFLFDAKTNQIHLPDSYARNFYFFRRNIYPQLNLVQMDQKEAAKLLEKSAFNSKVLEQSKVLFFRKFLDSAPINQLYSSVALLHEELIKLPMFPRKALEADFGIFSKLPDRELLTTDMLHKYSWCQLIWSLFSSMDPKTATIWDIEIFLNVINGSFLLHCEDFNMIRTCLALYINFAFNFKHIFATNGFMLIIPTLMKIYSNMQSNLILKTAIEFACVQFYIMHRIPFLLQLFGSVAQILDFNVDQNVVLNTNKVQASYFFDLVLAMESNVHDQLKILELVRAVSTNGQASNSSGSQATSSSANQNESNKMNHHEMSSSNNYESNNAMNTSKDMVNTPINVANFSSPVNLLTNAGSSTAVLAVSGISATNLLITSSGALGINQIANLTAAANTNLATSNSANKEATGHHATMGHIASHMNTAAGAGLVAETNNPMASELNNPFGLNNLTSTANPQITQKPNDNHNKSIIKALDFCYSDDTNAKLNMIDAINLCVTVIAYSAHAKRTNQMLIILDALLSRYLKHIKQQTEKVLNSNKQQSFYLPTDKQSYMNQAKQELYTIQKVSIALKTLVNSSEFLTRVYNQSAKTESTGPVPSKISVSMNPNSTNRSPSILPDEDSMRLNEEGKKAKQTLSDTDEKQFRHEFRSPRDTLLNIVSEFGCVASKRHKELYKIINDSSIKLIDLIDTKTHSKLVEIANTLLKQWDDSIMLNGDGVQNYFQKLIPITDWTEEELKPAFNNLLRRIDRLFTKISKRQITKKHINWQALGGIINGLYMTLEKEESIANFPYFKLLVNSAIMLIVSENSQEGNVESLFNASLSNEVNSQSSVFFSKAAIRLIGRYIQSLKVQSTIEQLFGNSNAIVPTMPSGVNCFVFFMLPLLFWSASERRDSPKFNASDISFLVSLVLNSLKPPSKLAATLLLQAPKQQNILSLFESSSTTGVNNKSAKQMKEIVNQSTFLALKLIVFSFSKQIELEKVATAIKQICFKTKSVYLWRFIDFITSNRTPLFLMLKPFIENFVYTQSSESEVEESIRRLIIDKLNCIIPTNNKCNQIVLTELFDEFVAIKSDLQGQRFRRESSWFTNKPDTAFSRRRMATINVKNFSVAGWRNRLNSNVALNESRKSKVHARKSLGFPNAELSTPNSESNALPDTNAKISYLQHLRKYSFVRRTASFTAVHHVEAIKALPRRSFTVHSFYQNSRYYHTSPEQHSLKYRHLRYRHTTKILSKTDCKTDMKITVTNEKEQTSTSDFRQAEKKLLQSASSYGMGTSLTVGGNELQVTSASATSTPNKTAAQGFKFNKTKKDRGGRAGMEFGVGGLSTTSNPNSQSTSSTNTPRKKIEKLDYRSGVDILEAYKAKLKIKMQLYKLNNPDSQIGTDENKNIELKEKMADEEIIVVEIDRNGNQNIKQTTQNEHMETSNSDAHKSSILKQQGNEIGQTEQSTQPSKSKKIVFV